MIDKLSHLQELPQGWGVDGNERQITDAAVGTARSFLSDAAIVPLADGGLQIEWHRDGTDLEVEIDAEGHLCCVFIKHNGYIVSFDDEGPPLVAPER